MEEYPPMTAPSRTAEIRRRRTRKEKIRMLRLRYMKASGSDKDDIFAKVKQLSPGMTREEFEAPINRKKE